MKTLKESPPPQQLSLDISNYLRVSLRLEFRLTPHGQILNMPVILNHIYNKTYSDTIQTKIKNGRQILLQIPTPVEQYTLDYFLRQTCEFVTELARIPNYTLYDFSYNDKKKYMTERR
jgi:hypothetical protein